MSQQVLPRFPWQPWRPLSPTCLRGSEDNIYLAFVLSRLESAISSALSVTGGKEDKVPTLPLGTSKQSEAPRTM